MLEISKYKDYKKTTEYQPDEIYKQVDSNPTAIASLLTQIDMLKEGECIVIHKIG